MRPLSFRVLARSADGQRYERQLHATVLLPPRVRIVGRDGAALALADGDGVEGHPQGLQRGGAEAVHRGRGHVVVDAGASCVIQPGGSMRDQEVIDAADERGVVMVLSGVRHFRH